MEVDELIEQLNEIADALHSTNAIRSRQLKSLIGNMERKIRTLESNLKDINALYMKALDNTNLGPTRATQGG